jgi:hypothetical protein
MNQLEEEPQALVATSTTYLEPIPVSQTKSSRAGSIDHYDHQ